MQGFTSIVQLSSSVNSQNENGFTRLPNKILDHLCTAYIPARERQCLDLIIRKTYGYGKKEDRISYSQFVKATGLKTRSVRDCLSSLEEKKIISVTFGAFQKSKTYSLDENLENWSVQKNTPCAGRHAHSVQADTQTNVQTDTHHKRKNKILKKAPENILGEFKNKSLLPKDYPLSDYHQDYALKKGFDLHTLEMMFEKFKAHHEASGTKFNSWRAAWRKWVINQIEYHGVKSISLPSSQASIELTQEEQMQEFLA